MARTTARKRKPARVPRKPARLPRKPAKGCCDEVIGSSVPTLMSTAGGTPVYGNLTACTYTKHGNRVFFELTLRLTGLGTLAAGSVYIEHNMPFNPVSTTGPQPSLAVGPTFNLASTVASPLVATMVPYISLYKFSSGTSTGLRTEDLTPQFSILISGCFHV